MKRSTSYTTSNPGTGAPIAADPEAEIVETSGEVFDDGSRMELVRPEGDKPQLLLWQKGRKPIVAPQIPRDGKLFTPISADISLWRATKLPSGLKEHGTSLKLFGELVDLF